MLLIVCLYAYETILVVLHTYGISLFVIYRKNISIKPDTCFSKTNDAFDWTDV